MKKITAFALMLVLGLISSVAQAYPAHVIESGNSLIFKNISNYVMTCAVYRSDGNTFYTPLILPGHYYTVYNVGIGKWTCTI